MSVAQLAAKVSDEQAEQLLRDVVGDALYDELLADPDGTGKPAKKSLREVFGNMLIPADRR